MRCISYLLFTIQELVGGILVFLHVGFMAACMLHVPVAGTAFAAEMQRSAHWSSIFGPALRTCLLDYLIHVACVIPHVFHCGDHTHILHWLLTTVYIPSA